MNDPLAKLTVCPADVQTATDYLAYAQLRLNPAIQRYLQDGCGDGLTLAANEHAFRSPILPRPLADVRGGHTRVRLFGQELAHPIVLAPIAYQRLFHPAGECASAMAASAQDGLMAVSSLASQTLEDIAQAAVQPLWFQLYWQGERGRTLRLVQRAQTAGYSAVVMTIDAPVKQAIMQLPADVAAVNLEAPPASPALLPGQSPVFDGWMAQAPTWADIEWLREQIKIPFLLKGVLHPDDAAHAVRLGCDGLIVSNHGGRVLDGAPASLSVLPQIVDIVAGRATVLLDSGIRNGRDIFRALSLGAAAVMIGRPYVWGLASAGALGVAHVIRLMRDELEMTLALAGCASIDDAQRLSAAGRSKQL
ncbi:MAG: alpha-hydroxy acid oxidase [Pseudomonadota bacterium]